MKIFTLEKSCKDTNARAGIISTDHGNISTPFFMPVGTYGAVKTQSSKEIKTLPKWDEQICLQGTKTFKGPFAGVGKVINLPEKEIEFKNSFMLITVFLCFNLI